MTTEFEQRKREEREFHNLYRAVHEQGGDAFEYYTSNKKFYSVVRKSNEYVADWIKSHARGGRLLEYGCGGGSFSFVAAETAKHVTGIDISDESIALCRQRAAERGLHELCSFEVMDCENLTFPDNSFDVVCEAGVLHHLDTSRVWPQVVRVLAPGGSFICGEALGHNPLFQLYRRLTPQLRTAWETEHILKMKDIRRGAEHFERCEIRFFHLATLAAVPLRNTPLFPAALATLESVDDVLMKVPLLQQLAWIAVFILTGPKK
jgi:ubiquinone/menaquinone biosynthesis C-methylase UbiE